MNKKAAKTVAGNPFPEWQKIPRMMIQHQIQNGALWDIHWKHARFALPFINTFWVLYYLPAMHVTYVLVLWHHIAWVIMLFFSFMVPLHHNVIIICCCLHVFTLQVLISLHQWDNSEMDNKKTRVNGIALKYVMLLVLDCTLAFIYLFYLLAVLKVLFMYMPMYVTNQINICLCT